MKRKKRAFNWKELPPPYEVGKNGFTLRDLKPDKDGYFDPAFYLPACYELVELYLEKKIIKGWWTGKNWDGYKFKKDDKVFFWKKKEEYNV